MFRSLTDCLLGTNAIRLLGIKVIRSNEDTLLSPTGENTTQSPTETEWDTELDAIQVTLLIYRHSEAEC